MKEKFGEEEKRLSMVVKGSRREGFASDVFFLFFYSLFPLVYYPFIIILSFFLFLACYTIKL